MYINTRSIFCIPKHSRTVVGKKVSKQKSKRVNPGSPLSLSTTPFQYVYLFFQTLECIRSHFSPFSLLWSLWPLARVVTGPARTARTVSRWEDPVRSAERTQHSREGPLVSNDLPGVGNYYLATGLPTNSRTLFSMSLYRIMED